MKRVSLGLSLVLLVLSLALSTAAGEGSGIECVVRLIQQQPGIRVIHGYYLNWAGYAVENLSLGEPLPPGSVTYVYGQFNVPTVVESEGCVSFWVGIDGCNSPTVEQTGAAALWNPITNEAFYYAWWEMYPQMPYTIGGIEIKAGDVMEASVEYDAATQTFTFRIKDLTAGSSFTQTRKAPKAGPKAPLRTSAEWVVERPMARLRGQIVLLPLAEFTEPVVFRHCQAIVSGEVVGIKGSGEGTYDEMTMVDPSQTNPNQPPEFLPLTSIRARGKYSFCVTWLNAGEPHILESTKTKPFGERLGHLLGGSGFGG
ncbi:MAG: G1 family glutamic endopeptidase [Nitrososphaeria archaeon]